MSSLFHERDIEQIEARGITLEKVQSHIETFRKGFSYARLLRSCSVGDGITVLDKGELERLGEIGSRAILSGRTRKFVPASGAASRMFQALLSLKERPGSQLAAAKEDDPDSQDLLRFIGGIKRFAFYDDLRSVMSRDSLDIEALIARGDYRDILEYLLTARGLNYGSLPKGLIKFHRYLDHCRTPFEEHLVEAVAYTQDRNGVARVHFTVSPVYAEAITKHITEVRGRYETAGITFEISFSVQNPSTDTLAVDLGNRPFRDQDGRLVFRPGGHGALLENLNDLRGEITFIKNIDNVVPDRLKGETYIYKKALAGFLLELQRETFAYLKALSSGEVDERLLAQVFDFARSKLSILPPKGIGRRSREERVNFLVTKLHRPIRACGMVRALGASGGGPFWVGEGDDAESCQIVESSQVNMESGEQRRIWTSATHFNPVFLVCGVRDHLGRPFDLTRFTDPSACFISIKSMDGEELKALELPGLWNGAMAHWNTVFIEVPVITFNPVKTVFDLLREEHQAN